MLETPLAPEVCTSSRQSPPGWLAEDAAAIRRFLSEYKDSPDTLKAYQREAFRLLKWCADGIGRSLKVLTRADMESYRGFLLHPPPSWCGKPVRMMIGDQLNPAWRPMRGPMRPGTVKQALTILNSMFGWLQQEGYLERNPLALMRRRDPGAVVGGGAAVRSKPRTQLNAEHLRAIEAALQTPRERWLLALLRYTGLRLQEGCKHNMGDISKDLNGHWTLTVTGKGGKVRRIPICESLLRELAAWRMHLGHPPMPEPGDHHPLFQRKRSDTRRLHPRSVTIILGRVFARAGLPDASPHRLRRHFATSLRESGADPKYVQELMGHSRFETTAIYLDVDPVTLRDTVENATRVL